MLGVVGGCGGLARTPIGDRLFMFTRRVGRAAAAREWERGWTERWKKPTVALARGGDRRRRRAIRARLDDLVPVGNKSKTTITV